MLYKWAKELFPINRSLTGEGVRETLNYLKKINKNLKIKNVNSNVRAFDWKIPLEWKIKEAHIENIFGKKIVDFKKNNLHVVGYSKLGCLLKRL